MFFLCAAFASLVVSCSVTALQTQNVQVQLEPGFPLQKKQPVVPSDFDPIQWNINEIPNPNMTDHFVFDTVYSLLQHWANVRLTRGHNIVPGIVPEGTLLHHARNNGHIPEEPDWIAMDPAHAYFCCDNCLRPPDTRVVERPCWLLTLVTARPLKVIYFDGLSAFKVPFGTLDTQDLLVWGESDPERVLDDKERIDALCNWGKYLNIDGFVRMEMAFEIMLCDFTSGADIVSFMNVTSRYGIETDFRPRVLFEAWHAGSRHNRFPGETRIQLDLSHLVSFYDTELAPSLVAARAGKKRRDHRVRGISKEDLSAAVSRLEAVLARPTGLSSRIDWKTVIQVVVDNYAEQLWLIRHLLNTTVTSPDHALDFARKIQMQLRIMLTPYLPASAVPPVDLLNQTALRWTAPVYSQCATAHTRWAEPKINTMTESEKLLLRAVRGTTREICRVVTKMWTAGVYAGIDPLVSSKAFADIAEVWIGWGEDLNSLMAWLDWSVWTKCEPGCGPEEICYLMAWPEGTPQFPLQPKCVSMVDLSVRLDL